MKQSRMPPVMKEAMKNTISGILKEETEEAVTERNFSLITSIMGGKIDLKKLCMKGKIERDLSKYKVLSGSSAGAAWANEFLGKGYRAGSFFLVTLNKDGKYIAFDDPSDIEGILPYYELAKWDSQPLLNAKNGLSNIQWI